MSVANYVETTLDLFGIAFGSAKRASQANSDSADIDINSVVEAVVKFRNSIRSYALSDAVTKENKKQLFAYCDQIRNELQQLKIELKVTFFFFNIQLKASFRLQIYVCDLIFI